MKEGTHCFTIRPAVLNGLMVLLLVTGCMTGDSAPQSSDNPSPVSTVGKIDAALAMVLNDPAAMERLKKNPKAARSTIPFVVEDGPDGGLMVPLFVESADVAATAAAIRSAGGSVETTMGKRLIARVPLDGIARLAQRADVVRVESTSRAELKRP